MTDKNINSNKRRRLSIDEKQKILEFSHRNLAYTQRKLAKYFNMPLGTLNGILQSAAKLKTVENPNQKTQRNNFKTKALDEKLFELFIQKRKRFITIQDANLQEMALNLAKAYNIEDFKASAGWVQSFKKRHNISSRLIAGEAGLVNQNVLENFKSEYASVMSEFTPDNIFNCDETGLFFKCTPSRTLSHNDEELISGKFSKERITILFCVSLSGEKIKPLIIGKAKTPRGFKKLNHSDQNFTYEYNKKAWMNTAIFCRWLEQLNIKMNKEGRKILLTLDNAPVHPVDVEYSNIQLLYFPPNVTSKIQPLDQGIIKSFKVLYKRKLNSKINFELDQNELLSYNDLLKQITFCDALMMILETWTLLPKETIINCYNKAINNGMLDVEELFGVVEPEVDDNAFSCYQELLPDEEFMAQIHAEIEHTNSIEEIDDESSSTVNEKIVPTYFETLKNLNNIELYCLENSPESLEQVYHLKKSLEKKKHKDGLTMLDFLERKK